jgi:uncharacterized protein GlcG (DUF336 family)
MAAAARDSYSGGAAGKAPAHHIQRLSENTSCIHPFASARSPSRSLSLHVVRAVQRADTAGSHTLAASERKAWTSASAKAPTLAMMENAQKNPGAANLVNIPGFLLLGGGVPVKAGNEVIGAVGVGGAPGGHLDEQCANAGIEKVKAQLG